MILINMMMAIINMAFEEIKEQKDTYQNKFEIIEYIKRSVREMTGVRLVIVKTLKAAKLLRTVNEYSETYV